MGVLDMLPGSASAARESLVSSVNASMSSTFSALSSPFSPAAHKAQQQLELFAARLHRHLCDKAPLDAPVFVQGVSMADERGAMVKSPCCLLALQPFCPGGKQTLLLNGESDLVRKLAGMACSADTAREALALEFGEALLTTSSYFSRVMTTGGVVRAGWTRSLSCGPYLLFCGPVPLQLGGGGCVIVYPKSKSPSGLTDEVRWRQRDLALQAELSSALDTLPRHATNPKSFAWPHAPAPPSISTPSQRPTAGGGLDQTAGERLECATFSPLLPVVLGMMRSGRSLPDEVSHLLRGDRMFCLGVFLGVPLVDRTGVLPSTVRTKSMRPTPTAAQVAAWHRKSLGEVCSERAEAIWIDSEATGRRVQVMYSGGIDSRMALIAMLRRCGVAGADGGVGGGGGVNRGRLSRLEVCYDEASIRENPLFWERFVKGSGVKTVDLTGQSVAGAAVREGFITVTGEGGDQLFGCMKMSHCFQGAKAPMDPRVKHFAKGLEERWEVTLVPSLSDAGLLCSHEKSWLEWISPQLAQCPLPVVSTFDILWWLNFSMRWQQVSFRMLHACTGDRVGREAATGAGAGWDLLYGLEHFYMSRDFEMWACCPENHAVKFADLKVWKTYKQPLKEEIYLFTGDGEYRSDKEKVGSMLREHELELGNAVMGISPSGHVLRWGPSSLLPSECLRKYGTAVLDLLVFGGSAAREREEGTWDEVIVSDLVHPVVKSPLLDHMAFVEKDSRQRREWNPVTLLTLEIKCRALLPPSLVQGRSLLDLGSCLGAMSHWALSHGASRAVLVDAQEGFVERSRGLMLEAGWSETPMSVAAAPEDGQSKGNGLFSVALRGMLAFLQSCDTGSFDVVLAAGVIHCVTDPCTVLRECARVARVAVCVESVTPDAELAGLGSRWEAPSAEFTMHSLCNMSDQDASLQGSALIANRSMVECVLRAGGLGAVSRVHVKRHPDPDVNRHIATYSTPRAFCQTTTRFFVRALRTCSVASRGLSSLEDQVASGEGTVREWGSGAASGSVAPSREGCGGGDRGSWVFDDRVAASFTAEAESNIPGYRQVIQLSLAMLGHMFPPSPTVRLLEIGCANGNTLKALLAAGYADITALDTSQPMLAQCAAQVPSIPTSSLIQSATIPPSLAPFDAIFANWTLHFITDLAEREAYILACYAKLREGGLLVLTEKTMQPESVRALYASWKRQQGLTDLQIAQKEAALSGVLSTAPAEWYHRVLARAGFSEVCVAVAQLGFVTWTAVRREAGGGV